MSECHKSSCIAFFDSLALKWDGFHDLKALSEQLAAGLSRFGIKPGEHVLDVGCGTGNLITALLPQLSSDGRIIAVDWSAVMIQMAKLKVNDPRVAWICGAIENLIAEPESFDRIICYSIWPHIDNAENMSICFRKWLKPGGKLHIWHTISREMVNKIHSEASPAVQKHRLAPSAEVALLLEQTGFTVDIIQDDNNGYLLTAQKSLK